MPLSQQISASSFLFAKIDQSNMSDTSAHFDATSLFSDGGFSLKFSPVKQIKTE